MLGITLYVNKVMLLEVEKPPYDQGDQRICALFISYSCIFKSPLFSHITLIFLLLLVY